MGSASPLDTSLVDPETLAGTELSGRALDALAIGVPAGTTLLVTGPPLSGKTRLATAALVAGHAAGAGAVAVTTEEPGAEVRARFERFAGPVYDPDRVAVVDCTGGPDGDLAAHDQRVSSPSDLTGTGMALTRALKAVSARDGRYRLCFDSLSTLLSYRDRETTFKFTHTLCSRLREAGALGLFTLDAPAHDDRTVNTLRRVFDGVAQLDADEDGHRVRVQGLGDGGWQRIDLPE